MYVCVCVCAGGAAGGAGWVVAVAGGFLCAHSGQMEKGDEILG